MQLNVKQFGLATGAIWGAALLVLTLVAAARGIGNNLSHISAVFVGYQISYLGSVIGLIYGFVSGLIAGSLFAMVYNASAGGASGKD